MQAATAFGGLDTTDVGGHVSGKSGRHAVGNRRSMRASRLSQEHCMTTWKLDLKTRCFEQPQGMLKLLGLASGADGLGLARFYESVLDGERQAVRGCMEAAVDGRHVLSLSFQIVRPDGPTASIAMSGCLSRSRTGGWRLAGIAFEIAHTCHAELETLRRVDRCKDEFIAAMAHELRNPLAAVLYAGDLVAKSAPAGSPLAGAGAALRRQTRHLASLVDELRAIGYSGVARPSAQMNVCCFDDVMRDAVEQVAPRMSARAHCFTIEAPSCGQAIYGNFTRLVQIVANLLNNASKYTPDGGTIRVWVETAENQLRCTISDSGIGMAAEFIGRAFEPFVQAPGDSVSMHEGIGLGLKLVRELTEIHGGTVNAHSGGEGCGATIVLELPLAHPPAA